MVTPKQVQKSNHRSENGSDDGMTFKQIYQHSDEIIFGLRSVFPLQLFPDAIVIDYVKVDIVYGIFFKTQKIFPILIQDITTVKISYGILFATLSFEVRGYEKNPQPVGFLKKDEAITARRIIMGLIACKRNKVDLTQLSPGEAAEKLEEIGSVEESSLDI